MVILSPMRHDSFRTRPRHVFILATPLTMQVAAILWLEVAVVVHPVALLVDHHVVACLLVVTMVRAMAITTPTDPSVRFVAKLVTLHVSAGIAWMKAIRRILIQLLWLPHPPTRLIPTGIVIGGQQITLKVILII
jgi:hypothetical protein